MRALVLLVLVSAYGCDKSLSDAENITGVGFFKPVSTLNPKSALMPYVRRAVLLLDFGTNAKCTGFLGNSGDTVITAGHCVPSDTCRRIRATVQGYSGYSRCTAALMSTEKDLAVLWLDKPLPVSELPSLAVDRDPEAGQYLLIFGYPGSYSELMYSAVCKVAGGEGVKVHYDCNTLPGMSGSAVFSVNPRSPNPYQLLAVHTGAHGSWRPGVPVKSNEGTRLLGP